MWSNVKYFPKVWSLVWCVANHMLFLLLVLFFQLTYCVDCRDLNEDRRARLREIELKAVQYQDELECGQRTLKSGWSIQQQVEHYRRKLLRKVRCENFVPSQCISSSSVSIHFHLGWCVGLSFICHMFLGYRLDDRGLIPSGCWEFFSKPSRPERLCGPPSLLSNGYQGLFPWG
jgi:hypothetical protein